MAHSYLPVDRDQLFLLPPSMREWLPEGHLAWFVLDVVSRADTSVLHARHPNDGVGRRAYDPDMVLALLLYAYCMGVRSSRQIERLCEVDVAFRVLAGGHQPDHSTIARFRQGHHEAAVGLFSDVLAMCAEAGMVRVGVVAVDGTKIAANASLKANRTRQQIEVEVRAMFDEAARVDAEEDVLFGDRRGDELPEELADPRTRGARLDAALMALKAREAERFAGQANAREARGVVVERAALKGRRVGGRAPREMLVEVAEEALAAVQAKAEQRAEERKQREAAAAAAGRKMMGGPTVAPQDHSRVRKAHARVARAKEKAAAQDAQRDDRVNVTDPDSRIMNSPKGWVQGYNPQAAVSEDGIVVAVTVTNECNDYDQFTAMMDATVANLTDAGIVEPIGTMLFDAGYHSEQNLSAPGPNRLIADSKVWKLRRETSDELPEPDPDDVVAVNHYRLRSGEGAAIYKKRQHTVEPVFGDIKELRGFRRFSHRGLQAVTAEWLLQTTVHNIAKMFRHQPIPAL